MIKITVLNGPNLNLVGTRQPGIYGSESIQSYLDTLSKSYNDIEFTFHQTNVEGELINLVQQYGFNSSGIILNAGGYTHTSVAIADAVAAIQVPVIEVHISNILAREEERRVSLLSKYCKGSITGLGLDGYELAVRYLAGMLRCRNKNS